MKSDSVNSVWFNSENHHLLVDVTKPVKPGDLVVDLNVSEETSNGSGDLVVKLRQLDADEKCSVILGKATHIARHFPFD